MGNGLTSDRYSLIKEIASVTNTRHRSHGNYLRATSEFSGKSLTVEGYFFACGQASLVKDYDNPLVDY